MNRRGFLKGILAAGVAPYVEPVAVAISCAMAYGSTAILLWWVWEVFYAAMRAG